MAFGCKSRIFVRKAAAISVKAVTSSSGSSVKQKTESLNVI
jgi:hypothetical protein